MLFHQLKTLQNTHHVCIIDTKTFRTLTSIFPPTLFGNFHRIKGKLSPKVVQFFHHISHVISLSSSVSYLMYVLERCSTSCPIVVRTEISNVLSNFQTMRLFGSNEVDRFHNNEISEDTCFFAVFIYNYSIITFMIRWHCEISFGIEMTSETFRKTNLDFMYYAFYDRFTKFRQLFAISAKLFVV